MYQQIGLKCPACKDIIYSNSRHDMEWCLCGQLYIDGGYDYIHAGGRLDATEVTRMVPDKNGKRDQPYYYKDEPARAAVLQQRARD